METTIRLVLVQLPGGILEPRVLVRSVDVDGYVTIAPPVVINRQELTKLPAGNVWEYDEEMMHQVNTVAYRAMDLKTVAVLILSIHGKTLEDQSSQLIQSLPDDAQKH